MVHFLKILPKYFESVLTDEKKAELRYNDRCFSEGDVLLLMEFDNESCNYTGRMVARNVTHVLDLTLLGKSNWVMLSMSPIYGYCIEVNKFDPTKLPTRQVYGARKGS